MDLQGMKNLRADIENYVGNPNVDSEEVNFLLEIIDEKIEKELISLLTPGPVLWVRSAGTRLIFFNGEKVAQYISLLDHEHHWLTPVEFIERFGGELHPIESLSEHMEIKR